MNPEIQLLLSVWDAVKTYIPKKDRIEAAEHVFRVFDEESDMSGVEGTAGLDTAMITAVKSHYGVEDFDDDDDDYEWE